MSDSNSLDTLGPEPTADWLPDDARQRLEALRPQIDELKSTLRKLLLGHDEDGYSAVQLYSEFAVEAASLGARANLPETFPDQAFSRRAGEHFKFLICLRIAVAEWTLSAIAECGQEPLRTFLADSENARQFNIKLHQVIEEAVHRADRTGSTEPKPDESGGKDAGPAVNANAGNGSGPEEQFPKRAAWLKDRLRERSWNKHDLSRHGGPDHKTAQKVLDGFPVRDDVLQKVADGLSKGKVNGATATVSVLDIPQD